MQQQEWNEHYENNEEPWTTPDEMLVAEAEGLTPGRALDLGAGEGADSIWLAERGWDVTAVDFAPAAISRVSQIASRRGLSITGVVANVLEYRPENRYDLVILCYMHLPAEERATMLANAGAALAPDGTLLYIGAAATDQSWEEEHRHLLAMPDEIVAELPGLAIERAEVIRRRMPYPEDPNCEGDGLVVRGRRPADGAGSAE